MMFFRATAAIAALAIGVAMLGDGPAMAQDTINPADFSATVDNPYFPLSTMRTLEYEGKEQDGAETIETRGVITVLDDETTVAGVRVLVVRDQAYADGELVEETLDYYAQHRDGTVYYFGEDVDNYEDGVLVDHDGSWLAGVDGALPGIFMPATPAVGTTFEQERAPGVAEDESKVVETGLSLTVPAGTFSNCIKTEDFDPIGDVTENKWYCNGVGLAREEAEDEVSQLVRFSRAPAQPAATTTVAPTAAATATRVAGTIGAPATGMGGRGDDERWLTFAAAVLLAAGACAVGVAVAKRPSGR